MSNFNADSLQISDAWVEHPRGRLFARAWHPPGQLGHPSERAPIVLLHDSLGCVDLWREFPAQLAAAAGRTVIAYDRLGFGKSDPRADLPAVGFVADEAKTYFPAVKAHFGFDRFIAFGHSVGGGMAVHCAVDFGPACLALITESAQAFAEDQTLRNIAAAREQFKDERQLDRLRRYHGDKARWVVDAWTETWLSPAFASWSIADVLPAVMCPVLALHGEHDEYGSNRHPEMIARLSGGPARAEIIAGAYHVPHRERPEEILRLVSGFLKRFLGA
ncbi:Pimeloyl-ACP methyl ester carboxylesterase [Noviherbaspirillum humi]|uniref:Pimeloyl-ACP methyl ester carboxylesterase n=1 Tax=Noviherbaspirillum humi TaxID=1688639 RepID=A0A239EZY7_9BURK|nr:alpha/beta fold hydrolase [Noviherbaspirillum humi]SNS49472.1 Pimeloyl-ACP methyl ester carboxylesterase [Noviherbaspirillum humi]